MHENVLFKRLNFNSERNLVKGWENLNSKKNSKGSQAGPGSHSLYILSVNASGVEAGGRVRGAAFPDFGRSVNLIQTREIGADYAPPH